MNKPLRLSRPEHSIAATQGVEQKSGQSSSRGSSQGSSQSLDQGYYLPRHVSARFGARLRALRKEKNLTQLRMAIDFGIDRSFISDVERGRKSISLPMLEILACGLDMTMADLLEGI